MLALRTVTYCTENEGTPKTGMSQKGQAERICINTQLGMEPVSEPVITIGHYQLSDSIRVLDTESYPVARKQPLVNTRCWNTGAHFDEMLTT